jgi:ketosteroid isomerase-like protein
MTILAFGAGLIGAQPAMAESAPLIIHGPETVAREIAAADRAFSARSTAAGTAKAFRDFMDGKDGLEFAAGEPKRGAKEIYDAHGGDAPPKSVLTWEPTEIFASAGGDMGVSWGHWLSKPNDPAKKSLTGHYVTVWRKNPAGEWRGVVDIGDADDAS